MKREATTTEDKAADLLIAVKKNKLTTYQALMQMAAYERKAAAQQALKFMNVRQVVTKEDQKDFVQFLTQS